MAKRRRISTPRHQDDHDANDFDDSLFFSNNSGSSSPDKQPVQRNAANARERARMRVLSRAFSRLKTSLPWVPPDTKLSKLDTLRLASTYIAHLRKVLKEDQHGIGQIKKPVHPITLTWPFTISNRPSSVDNASSNHDVRQMADAYQNYPPCEYMATNYTETSRRESYGQYLF